VSEPSLALRFEPRPFPLFIPMNAKPLPVPDANPYSPSSNTRQNSKGEL